MKDHTNHTPQHTGILTNMRFWWRSRTLTLSGVVAAAVISAMAYLEDDPNNERVQLSATVPSSPVGGSIINKELEISIIPDAGKVSNNIGGSYSGILDFNTLSSLGVKGLFEKIKTLDHAGQKRALKELVDSGMLQDVVQYFTSFNKLSKENLAPYILNQGITDYKAFVNSMINEKLFTREEILQILLKFRGPGTSSMLGVLDLLVDNPYEWIKSLLGTANHDFIMYYQQYASFLNEQQRVEMYEELVRYSRENPMIGFDTGSRKFLPEKIRQKIVQDALQNLDYRLASEYMSDSDTAPDKNALLTLMIGAGEYLHIIKRARFFGLSDTHIYQYASLEIQKPFPNFRAIYELCAKGIIIDEGVSEILRYISDRDVKLLEDALLFPELHKYLANKDQIVEQILVSGNYDRLASYVFFIKPNKDQSQRLLDSLIKSDNPALRQYIGAVISYLQILGQ